MRCGWFCDNKKVQHSHNLGRSWLNLGRSWIWLVGLGYPTILVGLGYGRSWLILPQLC